MFSKCKRLSGSGVMAMTGDRTTARVGTIIRVTHINRARQIS